MDLSDLLTSDSGKDNKDLIVKVLTQRFHVTDFTKLVQLAADGAGQNLGQYKGCCELVCVLFNMFLVLYMSLLESKLHQKVTGNYLKVLK